jgi:hypothetical protein
MAGYGVRRRAAFVLDTQIIGQLISPRDLTPAAWMNEALLITAGGQPHWCPCPFYYSIRYSIRAAHHRVACCD